MLADILRELRKKFNLTQGELADALQVSHGTVSMWEISKRTPDIDTLCKIANYFRVTPNYLLGFSDNSHELSVEKPPIDELKSDEKSLLEAYRRADEEGKLMIRAAAVSESRRSVVERKNTAI